MYLGCRALEPPLLHLDNDKEISLEDICYIIGLACGVATKQALQDALVILGHSNYYFHNLWQLFMTKYQNLWRVITHKQVNRSTYHQFVYWQCYIEIELPAVSVTTILDPSVCFILLVTLTNVSKESHNNIIIIILSTRSIQSS